MERLGELPPIKIVPVGVRAELHRHMARRRRPGTARQGIGGCGGRQRSSPTGGAA